MQKLQIPLLYLPDQELKKLKNIGVFKLGKSIISTWLSQKTEKHTIIFLQN
jgi:hypothetical protein